MNNAEQTVRPCEEAIRRAARIFAVACAERDELPVDLAARAAYEPAGPSVEDIRERIVALRRTA